MCPKTEKDFFKERHVCREGETEKTVIEQRVKPVQRERERD